MENEKNEVSWLVVTDFEIIEQDKCKTFYTCQEFFKLTDSIEMAKKLIKDNSVISSIIYKKIGEEPIEYFCEFNKNKNE